MGTFWELDGKSSPYPLQKDKKHPLGACWCHPIGTPHKLYPKVFFLKGQARRIGSSHVWKFF
jgi:hypothetical protein